MRGEEEGNWELSVEERREAGAFVRVREGVLRCRGNESRGLRFTKEERGVERLFGSEGEASRMAIRSSEEEGRRRASVHRRKGWRASL